MIKQGTINTGGIKQGIIQGPIKIGIIRDTPPACPKPFGVSAR